jgi:hypothetical protein
MLKSAQERDKLARPFELEMRKFGELIRNDKTFLNELDEAADRDSFVHLYCRRAAENGLHFSKEDMLTAVQEQKHGSNWILPGVVLKMVAERF